MCCIPITRGLPQILHQVLRQKTKSTNVEDIQDHRSQMPILSSLTHNPTTDHSEIDLPKRQCTDQGNLLVALTQMIDTEPSHHPPNVMASNGAQAKQASTITGTNVSAGSISYLCPPEITEEHMAETKHNLLREQGSD